ncbi:MAG TPA: hypothetical protein VFL30_07680 [Rhodanobacteraceae bacterium]|nr:hypothetical protein [Rhodanobacteraceae bacterium]
MDATIEIRQWRNEIALPRDHPAPLGVRDTIDAAAAQVADTLADIVGAEIDRRAGEVILVREIVFDCDVDVASDRHALARTLARRCASALMHAVESGSPEVVRFPSRAALVAQLIGDIAAGGAWGRWYYRAFDGLAALPASAAIRTVLLDDRATGREALTLVSEAAWPALARAIELDDVVRVLEGLVEDDTRSDAFAPEPWVEAFRSIPQRDLVASPHGIALHFFAKALSYGSIDNAADAHAAWMLASIAVMVRSGDQSALGALLQGDMSDLERLEPAVAHRVREAMADVPSSALRALVAAVHDATSMEGGEAARTAASDVLDAPFAGFGLLIEEIGALLDRDAAAALALIEPRPARELAALASIAFAAGSDSQRVWRDPALRAFFGIGRDFAWSEYEAALRDSAAVAARALDALWASASRHARGEPIEVPLGFSGAPIICTVDASTGLWLLMRPRGAREATASRAFSNRLASARRARADARALVAQDFGATLPREWRLFFAAVAQIALRRIAQRVPGMRMSSLDYIRANLLRCGGEAVAIESARWRWRVRRPPLHVLLALSGIASNEQVWHGPDGERRVVQWDWR